MADDKTTLKNAVEEALSGWRGPHADTLLIKAQGVLNYCLDPKVADGTVSTSMSHAAQRALWMLESTMEVVARWDIAALEDERDSNG